ncbi:MAG: FtsQ-type POTRA domain-containing protein [Candidatus Hydrogenedentota bacterium]
MLWKKIKPENKTRLSNFKTKKREVLTDHIRWGWAIMKGVRIGALILLFELLIFSVIELWDFLYDNPSFVVREIVIEGNKYIDDNYFKQKSGIRIQENIFRIEPRLVKNRILKDRRIENVVVRKELFNRIVIEIKEREPYYYLVISKGMMFVDKNGVLFTLYKEIGYPSLPVIRIEGDKNFRLKSNDLPEGYKIFISEFEAKLNDTTKSIISEIAFTDDDRVLLYTKKPVTKIIISLAKLERCLKRLVANIDLLLADKNVTEYIDLRFEELIVK